MARLPFSTKRTSPRTRRLASSSMGRATSTHHMSPASWPYQEVVDVHLSDDLMQGPGDIDPKSPFAHLALPRLKVALTVVTMGLVESGHQAEATLEEAFGQRLLA